MGRGVGRRVFGGVSSVRFLGRSRVLPAIEKIGKFPSERRIWALAAIEAIKQTYESPRGFRLRGADPNRG